MQVELRHNPSDPEILSQMSDMLDSSFTEAMRYPFRDLMPYFGRGEMDLWEAVSGGELVGFAVAIPSDTMVYILFLVVDRGQRSKGYGSAALSALREKYPGKPLVLDCEEDLIPFYERNGIHDTGYRMEFRNILLYVMCESELDTEAFFEISLLLAPLEADDGTDFVWIEPDGTRHVIS